MDRRLLAPLALAATLAGCASGPVATDASGPVATDGSEPVATVDEPASTPTAQAPPSPDPGTSVAESDTERPRLFFTAHGEGAPNTFGPGCAMGIETTSSNLMRLTAPEGWVHRGSSGGSGPSALLFDVGGVPVDVDLVGNTGQLASMFDGHELGGQVGTADLDGTTFPVVEVSLGGGSTGYAMTDVPWLTNLPAPFGPTSALTVFVTSTQAGVPSVDDSVALLSSVRVERCEGIMESVIATSAGGTLAVPDIVDDPLGKTVPSAPQPSYDVQAGPDAWSAEQLAYLLPFPEPTDRCVAEVLQDHAVRDTLPPLLFIGPVVVGASGTNLEALEEIAAGC